MPQVPGDQRIAHPVLKMTPCFRRKKGKFHDCRSTKLSHWFAEGLSEYAVMKMAGHSSFETTHKFYLAIKKDYLDKARQANVGLGLKLVECD